MHCPRCETLIPNDNINIQADVGKCDRCEYVFKISEAISIEKWTSDRFDIQEIPKGAWLKQHMDYTIVGATTRSPIAFFLVPFMLIWSGGSLGGIYGSQIMEGKFNLMMSLFGIPFILGSIIFWSLALMAIWGKVEVRLDQNGGRVFTGIGILGWRKSFTWNQISKVREKQSNLRYPGSKGASIVLEGSRRISFGTGLNENRRYYLYRALTQLIKQYTSHSYNNRF